MKQPTGKTPSAAHLKVTKVRSGELSEIYVAAAPWKAEADVTASVESLYAGIAEQLEDASSLHVAAERVFGKLEAREAFLAARATTVIPMNAPINYIEGSSTSEKPLSGVQMTLVRATGRDAQIDPLRDGERVCGWSVTSGGVRRAYLSGIDGLTPGRTAPSAQKQARRMFERAEAVLASADMTYRNVVCTRIYLRRLLDWYDDFNAARNAFFGRLGLLSAPMPASTGIQGKTSEACECVMDVVAVMHCPGGVCPFVTLHNPLQNEATEYGSSFARGVRVDLGDARHVFVSGTASIDENGKSVHVGDLLGQTRRTMDNFKAILEAGGAKLSDLYHAVWYCKEAEYASAIREELRRRGWPEFPYVMAKGDVCRRDLLVEVDGAAVVTPS